MTPFRQRFEIALTGPEIDQNVVCNDFVIPLSQNETQYTIENVAHVALANTATVGMCAKETVCFGRCVQEVQMFDEFASLIQNNLVSEFWPQIAFVTQQIVDACLQSMKNGGQEVTGLEDHFHNYSVMTASS